VKNTSQMYIIAPVAQWTEHLTSDQTVERSNRSGGAYMWGYLISLPLYMAVPEPVNPTGISFACNCVQLILEPSSLLARIW
jgi:hypothetical protein